MLRTDQAQGFIEEYTNDKVCSSPLFIPGVFLMGEGPFGFVLILILLYLFVGVSVISDILSESIAMIQSEKRHD